MLQLRLILPSEPEGIIRCILDPSHFASTKEDILHLVYDGVTRRMCHLLHNHRFIHFDTGLIVERAVTRVTVWGINPGYKQTKKTSNLKNSK